MCEIFLGVAIFPRKRKIPGNPISLSFFTRSCLRFCMDRYNFKWEHFFPFYCRRVYILKHFHENLKYYHRSVRIMSRLRTLLDCLTFFVELDICMLLCHLWFSLCFMQCRFSYYIPPLSQLIFWKQVEWISLSSSTICSTSICLRRCR